MTDQITVTGLVATAPRHLVTSEGLAITSFRLASTSRRFERSASAWVDGDTNWFTVTAFRALAVNAATCVSKGERVIVTGALRIREWENGKQTGTNVDIEADAIGHDLAYGTAEYRRVVAPVAPAEHADATGDSEDEDAQEALPEPVSARAVPSLLEAALATGRLSIIPVGRASA
ncbi:MAG: single-stranded DNA-binding protein [Salinibacterium sp.]|nr:single-stranded DNA-binding protein [Salinibacterium sp.]